MQFQREHTSTNRQRQTSSIRRGAHIPTLLIGSKPNELLILSWSKQTDSHSRRWRCPSCVCFVYFLHEVLANVAAGKGRRQNFWLSLHNQFIRFSHRKYRRNGSENGMGCNGFVEKWWSNSVNQKWNNILAGKLNSITASQRKEKMKKLQAAALRVNASP